jgi:hypothetical protein
VTFLPSSLVLDTNVIVGSPNPAEFTACTYNIHYIMPNLNSCSILVKGPICFTITKRKEANQIIYCQDSSKIQTKYHTDVETGGKGSTYVGSFENMYPPSVRSSPKTFPHCQVIALDLLPTVFYNIMQYITTVYDDRDIVHLI